MATIASILEEYMNEKANFEQCNLKLERLLTDLLKNKKISFLQINSRVKEERKIEEKIRRKANKYSKLGDITDICGIRIITYFEDDIDRIAEIIKAEFAIDRINSIDKRKLEADRFGYRSLHFVASFSKLRLKLSDYKIFKNIKFEIQIRTLLQHSWAEIEHDIGYKNEIAIPESAKRTFYRVAALLETADLEFVKLKNLIREYEKNVKSIIQKSPGTVELNAASLNSFVRTNPIILQADKEVSYKTTIPIEIMSVESSLITRLNDVGIKTIEDLEKVINKAHKKLIQLTLESHTYQTAEETDFYQTIALSNGIILYHVDKLNKSELKKILSK